MMNLLHLKTGQIGIVERIISNDDTRGIVQRLEKKGIVSNKPVQVLGKSKLLGPLHIRVGSSREITIQRQEAEMIMVKTDISEQDMIAHSTTELTERFKTASLVSLTTIVLVIISGFYRILITGDIHRLNKEKVVANVVYDSTSTEKNKTLDELYNKFELLNKNSWKKNTHSPPQNVEPIANKITNETELLQLKQKLYNTIYKNWKTPVNLTSIYLVKIDKNGAIADYEPFNQIAVDNLEKTPIPSLVNSEANLKKESLKTEWAEFTILFYDNGNLEVQLK
ncbi:FeoA family protein [Okeania sp.]|uniref:FeoA family protein n=1 Tax=Okeania sp. TaxID=3100323 RepID=UPI002B4B6913|nr:FeoA family protein [Okeania sp.]MEB3343412.1 FeoA family protein [Okeania sp.]